MRRKLLITLTLLAYLGSWAATATHGISKAQNAARAGAAMSGWSAISPAPFWIVGDYAIWDRTGANGSRTHFLWVPSRILEIHTEDTGWAGCTYAPF